MHRFHQGLAIIAVAIIFTMLAFSPMGIKVGVHLPPKNSGNSITGAVVIYDLEENPVVERVETECPGDLIVCFK